MKLVQYWVAKIYQSKRLADSPRLLRNLSYARPVLAAPPVKSFNEFVKQTSDIVLANSLTAQGAQAKKPSEIGSGTVFKPNQDLLSATGASKRAGSPAFLQLTQEKPSTSANFFDRYSESDFSRRTKSKGFRLCVHS